MSRLIAQIIIQGTAVLTKVFISAYQQALQNAKRGGAGGAASVGSSILKGKMRPDEAMKILAIEKNELNKECLEKQFKKYFELNDAQKGGSFYLQSKIYRAKEALVREIEQNSDTGNKEENIKT